MRRASQPGGCMILRQLLLADQVATAPGPHAGRVHGASRNVGRALASRIRSRRATARQRHLSLENDVRRVHGVRVINDCYNANPASMRAALQLLAELGAKHRTIAVLGDMLELGPEAKHMHRAVGTFLAGQGITNLIACGVLGRELAQGARSEGMPAGRIIEVPDAATAGATLKSMVRQGDVVLVKASRGMQLEQVVEAVTGMRRAAKKAS